MKSNFTSREESAKKIQNEASIMGATLGLANRLRNGKITQEEFSQKLNEVKEKYSDKP